MTKKRIDKRSMVTAPGAEPQTARPTRSWPGPSNDYLPASLTFFPAFSVSSPTFLTPALAASAALVAAVLAASAAVSAAVFTVWLALFMLHLLLSSGRMLGRSLPVPAVGVARRLRPGGPPGHNRQSLAVLALGPAHLIAELAGLVEVGGHRLDAPVERRLHVRRRRRTDGLHVGDQ